MRLMWSELFVEQGETAKRIAEDVEDDNHHNEDEYGEKEIGTAVSDLVLIGMTSERFSITLNGACGVIDGLSELADDHILSFDLVSHCNCLALLCHIRGSE